MPILLALLLSAFAIDGDTIVINGRHIRIANIDAPEIHDYRCAAELRLGMLAKRRMVALLASGAVVVHEKPAAPFGTTGKHEGSVCDSAQVGVSTCRGGRARCPTRNR